MSMTPEAIAAVKEAAREVREKQAVSSDFSTALTAAASQIAQQQALQNIAKYMLIGGLGGALPSTDEYGNERGVAERLARGVTGAGLTAGTAHLLGGRNLGLAKSNVFNPILKKINPSLMSQRSVLSQKMLVPAAAGLAMAPIEGAAGDIAGGAGSLVDRAFGQSGEQS